MRKIILIIMIIGCALIGIAQPLLIPKGVKALTHVITPTEVSYLHGVTGPIETTFLKVSDGVLGSTLYYEKDTIDSKLSKKANLYQPNLVNPTVTTQAAGDNSTKAASTAFVMGNTRFSELTTLGSAIKAIPFNYTFGANSTLSDLIDGTQYFVLLDKIYNDITVTGIKAVSGQQGAFTEDNFCGAVLYSWSAGVYTKVAESANLPSQFKLTSGTTAVFPFTSPITMTKGTVYFACILYNSSGQTTAPRFYQSGASSGLYNLVNPSNLKINGAFASQTSAQASVNNSSLTTATAPHTLIVY